MKQPRLESGTEVPLSLDKVVVQTLTGAGLVLLFPLLQTRLRKWRQQIESTKNGEESRPDCLWLREFEPARLSHPRKAVRVEWHQLKRKADGWEGEAPAEPFGQ